MNTLERRALYNLLRMSWLNEPTLQVEAWQVEDYRALPISSLFERLAHFKILLDRIRFIAYADESDSPEELSEHLMAGLNLLAQQEDEAYLIIFELWRRTMCEKPSLSIICNELDYYIHLYDLQKLENPLALQDALTYFVQILDENADQGIPSDEVLKLVSNYCANDVETFLYDFISEQIDEGSESFAHDLLEDFDDYVGKNKWFKLLRIRLFEQVRNKIAQKLIEEIIEEYLDNVDLDFHLEFLSILAEKGDDASFKLAIQKTLPLIKQEEAFQDLLSIAIDYFHLLDQEEHEKALKTILAKRSTLPMDQALKVNDLDLNATARLFDL